MATSQSNSVCKKLNAVPQPPLAGSKVGIALDTISQIPINGMRIQPGDGTNGWFLWCGSERSNNADFFAPLHVEHLIECLPEAVGYLDLPPGYRFQIDRAGYEDVWFDPALASQSF
jgi:hypothetical protein